MAKTVKSKEKGVEHRPKHKVSQIAVYTENLFDLLIGFKDLIKML